MESKLTTFLLADAVVAKYSPDQPRDEHGRFGDVSAGSPEKDRSLKTHQAGANAMRATQSANAASHTAADSDHYAPHAQAIAAHERAAKMHREAAKAVTGERSELHRQMAEKHSAKASHHREEEHDAKARMRW
jgi:hypothetical protein